MEPVVEALQPPPPEARPLEPGQLSPSTMRPESTVRLKMTPPPAPGTATHSAAPKEPTTSTNPWLLAVVGAVVVGLVIYLVTALSGR